MGMKCRKECCQHVGCSCHAEDEKHAKYVPDPVEVAQRLRSRSLKMTHQRQAVLTVLQREQRPLTIREIHELLDTAGDLATVYRTMHVLQEAHLVSRCDFRDGVARFEVSCACGALHHYHVICNNCGEVRGVEIEFPDTMMEEIASQSRYSHLSPHVEFFGVCPACRKEGQNEKKG